jgi:hypothetical protein
MSKDKELEDLFLPGDHGPVWTTKDGRTMPMRDMEDSHLIRSIRLWRSRASALALGSYDPSDFKDKPWVTKKSYERSRAELLRRLNADLENLTAEAKRRRLGEWAAFGLAAAENLESD